MYCPCSENKDADQFRGYREADLRLCFRPCKLLVFSRTGSYFLSYVFGQCLTYMFLKAGDFYVNANKTWTHSKVLII